MKLREKKRPVEWPKAGWYWLLHHDTIVEWTDNIDERWDYVCSKKPLGELAVRQKWMRPVKGNLPEELLTALAKYDEARAKYVKALAKYRPQIEALMREELPGVPWDGAQLVFKGEV